MKTPIEAIKEVASIEDVVSPYVGNLRQAGINKKKCLCPLHHEKTPSFVIDTKRNTFCCFGCGAKGSVVDFIMQKERVSIQESIKKLSRMYGLALLKKNKDEYKRLLPYYRQAQEASAFFTSQFYKSPNGIKAYVSKDRGIDSKELIEKWGIGICGQSMEKQWKEIGLRNKAGNPLLQNRIIFTIKDEYGRVVGFSGRTIYKNWKQKNIGKYVNTPSTDIYNKSEVLYGLYEAQSIKGNMPYFLVEGQTDVIAMQKIGLKAVAPCGTSFTQQQALLLQKYTDEVIILYDADVFEDNAKLKNIVRAIEYLLIVGATVQVVKLESGDPFDNIKAVNYSKKDFLSKIDVIDNYFEIIKKTEGENLWLEKSCKIISKVPNSIKKSELINELALLSKVPHYHLFEKISKL